MARKMGDLASAVEGPIVPGALIYYPRDTSVQYFADGASSSLSGQSPAEATSFAQARTNLGGAGTLIGLGDGNIPAVTLTAGQHIHAPFMNINGAMVLPASGGNVVVARSSSANITVGANCTIKLETCTGDIDILAGSGHTHTRIEVNRMTGDLDLLGTGQVYVDIPSFTGRPNAGSMRILGPGCTDDITGLVGVQVFKSQIGVLKRVRSISADEFLLLGDDFVLCDTTTAALTATLPTAHQGDEKTIIDNGGNAATNAITIAADTGDTINGGASIQITVNNDQRRVLAISDSAWVTL